MAGRDAFLLCCLLLPVAAGCGGRDNFLEGSIGERFSLSFDRVEVERDIERLAVSYLDAVSYPEIAYRADNTVLQLEVALVLEEGMLDVWQDVTGAVDLERYIMVLDDPYSLVQDERRYPPEILARILCTQIGERAGDALEGQFYLVFEDGSTLRGGFSAPLEKDVP